MSKFYKEVATPETQGRQAVTPSGPSQDANARQEAANNTGGLGGAIQSLLGAVQAGASAVQKHDEVTMNEMKKQKNIEATAAASGGAEKIKSGIETYAQELGKQVWQLEPEELEQKTNEIVNDLGSEHNDKWHKPLIMEKLKEKRGQYMQHISKKNRNDKFSAKMTSASKDMKSELSVLNASNAKDFTKVFSDVVSGSVIETGRSEAEIARGLLGPMVQDLVMSDKANAMEVLTSPAFTDMLKEKYDMDDTRGLVNTLKQAMIAPIIKQRGIYEDDISEKAFAIVDSGGGSPKEIKEHIAERRAYFKKSENKIYSPSSKFWLKLEKELLETQSTQAVYQGMYSAQTSGDYTVSTRNPNFTEKDRKGFAIHALVTGTRINDLSPEGLMTAINSGSEDKNIQALASNKFEHSAPIVELFESKPIDLEGERNLERAFHNMVALTQSTGNSIIGSLKTDTITRILHNESINDKLDAGFMTKAEGHAAKASFANDKLKNTNSFGVYTGPLAASVLTKEHKEDIKEFGREGNITSSGSFQNWTIDDHESNNLISRHVLDTASQLIEIGYEPDLAISKAKDYATDSFKRFENPDGSEGVQPLEFKSFDSDEVLDMYETHPVVKELMASRTGSLGNDDYSTVYGDLSWHPTLNYNKTERMQLYYKGKPISGTMMSSDQMQQSIEAFRGAKEQSVKEAHSIKVNEEKVDRDKVAADFKNRQESIRSKSFKDLTKGIATKRSK